MQSLVVFMCSCVFLEGKAGGGPTVATKITKFKMQPDEALKILNIEKSNMNRNVVEEVSDNQFTIYGNIVILTITSKLIDVIE